MTATVPDTTSEQKTEDELWTAYMVALAREQENHRLYEEAWRDYVATGFHSLVCRAVWEKVSDLWDESRKSLAAADLAWKRVAYPLHKIALRDDNEKSS